MKYIFFTFSFFKSVSYIINIVLNGFTVGEKNNHIKMIVVWKRSNYLYHHYFQAWLNITFQTNISFKNDFNTIFVIKHVFIFWFWKVWRKWTYFYFHMRFRTDYERQNTPSLPHMQLKSFLKQIVACLSGHMHFLLCSLQSIGSSQAQNIGRPIQSAEAVIDSKSGHCICLCACER